MIRRGHYSVFIPAIKIENKKQAQTLTKQGEHTTILHLYFYFWFSYQGFDAGNYLLLTKLSDSGCV